MEQIWHLNIAKELTVKKDCCFLSNNVEEHQNLVEIESDAVDEVAVEAPRASR